VNSFPVFLKFPTQRSPNRQPSPPSPPPLCNLAREFESPRQFPSLSKFPPPESRKVPSLFSHKSFEYFLPFFWSDLFILANILRLSCVFDFFSHSLCFPFSTPPRPLCDRSPTFVFFPPVFSFFFFQGPPPLVFFFLERPQPPPPTPPPRPPPPPPRPAPPAYSPSTTFVSRRGRAIDFYFMDVC